MPSIGHPLSRETPVSQHMYNFLQSTVAPVMNIWILCLRFAYASSNIILILALYQLTTCKPPPPQNWPNWVFGPKRCSMFWNLRKKQFFDFCSFYFFAKWSILCWKFLENRPQYHHKWYCDNFCSQLDQNAFQKILRKWKKKSFKIISSNFGAKK